MHWSSKKKLSATAKTSPFSNYCTTAQYWTREKSSIAHYCAIAKKFRLEMKTNISTHFKFKRSFTTFIMCQKPIFIKSLITIQFQTVSSLNNVSKLAPTVQGSTTAVEWGCAQRRILFSYCNTINLEQSTNTHLCPGRMGRVKRVSATISAQSILPFWPHTNCAFEKPGQCKTLNF